LILVKLSAEQIARAKSANGERKRITHAVLCNPYGRLFGTEKQCLEYYSIWQDLFSALFVQAIQTDVHPITNYQTTTNLAKRLASTASSMKPRF